MDRGAWLAIVHGVAEGQTWLSDYTTLLLSCNSHSSLFFNIYFFIWLLWVLVAAYGIESGPLALGAWSLKSLDHQGSPSSSLLKDPFTGYRILGWQYFVFSTLKMLCHCLLAFMISDKTMVVWIIIPPYIIFCFSLATHKIYFLSLAFIHLIMLD